MFLPTWWPASLDEMQSTVCGRAPSWSSAWPLRPWTVNNRSMYLPHINFTVMDALDVIACMRFDGNCSGLTPFVLGRKWPLQWHNRSSAADCSLRVNIHPTNPTANVSPRLSGSAVLPISIHTWQALKIQHKPARMLVVDGWWLHTMTSLLASHHSSTPKLIFLTLVFDLEHTARGSVEPECVRADWRGQRLTAWVMICERYKQTDTT